MVFFQSLLLAGYAYAHMLTSRLALRNAIFVHVAVLLCSIAFLPINLPIDLASIPANGESLWLIGMFTAALGLPFFALSANGPLLQAWFARSGHPQSHDPYFLYGASNVGSFLSLFAYILLIEPVFGMKMQGDLWAGGFVLLCCCVMITGYLSWRQSKTAGFGRVLERKASMQYKTGVNSSWSEWWTWVGLAFIPSGLLVAVTAHISTDIAAAPFIWILPLACFLLTFILAFRQNTDWWLSRTRLLAPFLAFIVIAITFTIGNLPILFSLVLNIGTFFFMAMHCHLLLAKSRPSANQLTQFYFAMSCGGVLGGIFCGLIAPKIFNWNAEYIILLLVFFLTVKENVGPSILRFTVVTTTIVLAFVAIIFTIQLFLHGSLYESRYGYMIIAFLIMMSIGYAGKYRPTALPALCVCLVANGIFNTYSYQNMYIERSFFGVVKIQDLPAKGIRRLIHGTTMHGAMLLEDAKEGRPAPLIYYTDSSGMVIALRAARENNGGKLPLSGVIGIGTGSIACRFQKGEKLDLVDIDPLIVKVATDPRHFRFISECAPDANVEIGDGRKVLESRVGGIYDYLLIDAYSSDSIPVHMMTTDALSVFMSKIKEGGMLVMHLSNRHLDLASVAAANAKALGYSILVGDFVPTVEDRIVNKAEETQVAVLVREEKDFGALLTDKRWKKVLPDGVSPWTDDFANLLPAIKRRYYPDKPIDPSGF